MLIVAPELIHSLAELRRYCLRIRCRRGCMLGCYRLGFTRLAVAVAVISKLGLRTEASWPRRGNAPTRGVWTAGTATDPSLFVMLARRQIR
jgi:hypothetical protein